MYQLSEDNLSDIEKAPNTDRQYLGQPDMVRTKSGRLITAYPKGHGKGPLIMQISDEMGKHGQKNRYTFIMDGSQRHQLYIF